MALNAVMLNASTRKPVPLPDEKRFIEVENVETAMQGMSNSTTVDAAATPLKATGSVYVTSHRVVFVSSAPPSSLAEASSSQLVTLSCNLSHFQDGRLVQPWLAANYYEAVVLPQTGGKLDRPHSIKIHFRNGRAYEFYQALEEAKTRYEEVHGRGRPVEEPLPLYEAGQAQSSTTTRERQVTEDDISAANCARQAEDAEHHAAVHDASGDSNRGLPPSYTAASSNSG